MLTASLEGFKCAGSVVAATVLGKKASMDSGQAMYDQVRSICSGVAPPARKSASYAAQEPKTVLEAVRDLCRSNAPPRSRISIGLIATKSLKMTRGQTRCARQG